MKMTKNQISFLQRKGKGKEFKQEESGSAKEKEKH